MVLRRERDDRWGLELGELRSRVDVHEPGGRQLDDAGVEVGERVAQRELACGEPPVEHGERGLSVRAGQRPARRRGGVGAGGREGVEVLPTQERRVDRDRDDQVVRRRPQTGDEAGDRRAHVRPVIQERKRQLEAVRVLADGEPLVAGLAEQPPGPLRERLAVESRERLRRPEPPARPADQQDARQLSMRHASL